MTNIPAKRQPPTRHDGPAHSSPYPVSRLAPGFQLVDLAREIDQADQVIGSRLGGQLEVIAEGVESQQIRDFLVAAGCRRFQGFYYAEPMTLEAFMALEQRSTEPGEAGR